MGPRGASGSHRLIDIVFRPSAIVAVYALHSDQVGGIVDDTVHLLLLAHEETRGENIFRAVADDGLRGTKTTATILGLLGPVVDVLGKLRGFRRLSKDGLVKLGGGALVGLLADLADERCVLVSGLGGERAVSRSVFSSNRVNITVLALEWGRLNLSVAVGFGAGGKCRGGQNSKLLHLYLM